MAKTALQEAIIILGFLSKLCAETNTINAMAWCGLCKLTRQLTSSFPILRCLSPLVLMYFVWPRLSKDATVNLRDRQAEIHIPYSLY